jgi:hypothetical protein
MFMNLGEHLIDQQPQPDQILTILLLLFFMWQIVIFLEHQNWPGVWHNRPSNCILYF